MNDDKNSPADKIVGSTDLLRELLATFPFIPPSRTVCGEDENNIVEWQYENGKYFDIEDAGNGELEIMTCVDGVYRHWTLTPNAPHERA